MWLAVRQERKTLWQGSLLFSFWQLNQNLPMRFLLFVTFCVCGLFFVCSKRSVQKRVVRYHVSFFCTLPETNNGAFYNESLYAPDKVLTLFCIASNCRRLFMVSFIKLPSSTRFTWPDLSVTVREGIDNLVNMYARAKEKVRSETEQRLAALLKCDGSQKRRERSGGTTQEKWVTVVV